MSGFRMYQVCRSGDGWHPVEIRSSNGEDVYLVLVNPWGNPNENVCHCAGYNFRGQCRHQLEAAQSVCAWSSETGVEQTPEQSERKICPSCGGPTKYEVEAL